MFRSSYTLFQLETPSAGLMMNSDLRRCSTPTHTHPYRSNNCRQTYIQPESEYCRLLSSFLQSQHVNQHTAISPTPLQHNTHTHTHTDVTNSLFILSTENRIKMRSRSSKHISQCNRKYDTICIFILPLVVSVCLWLSCFHPPYFLNNGGEGQLKAQRKCASYCRTKTDRTISRHSHYPQATVEKIW